MPILLGYTWPGKYWFIFTKYYYPISILFIQLLQVESWPFNVTNILLSSLFNNFSIVKPFCAAYYDSCSVKMSFSEFLFLQISNNMCPQNRIFDFFCYKYLFSLINNNGISSKNIFLFLYSDMVTIFQSQFHVSCSQQHILDISIWSYVFWFHPYFTMNSVIVAWNNLL